MKFLYFRESVLATLQSQSINEFMNKHLVKTLADKDFQETINRSSPGLYDHKFML